MTYSKGPLQVTGPSDGKGPYDDGGDYAIVEIVESGCRAVIGEANYRVGENEYRDAEANARLWAAAPELLEACVYALIAADEQMERVSVDWSDVACRLEAAVAKARGEA